MATTKNGAAPSGPAPAAPPNHTKFIFGGLAGMAATCFVQPLDLIKNRMQLAGGWRGGGQSLSFAQTLSAIVRNEGALAVYTGLSAGLLRQATYTTTRLGVYTTLFDHFSNPNGTPPSFATKVAIGLTAGASGAIVGTPAEVALIRMSADGALPAAERRGYTGVGNALVRVAREEGIATLWRGCVPTVARAMVLNATQLASYSEAKQAIQSNYQVPDGLKLHFLASMVSGVLTTVASMPVDIVKTRIQNMRTINGVPEYSGVADVLGKVVRQEGFFALWKGFLPYYSRLGPHTVLTFIFLEQLNKLYASFASY
ncbi:uncharacterized protein MONBRDRAFT_18424 [Monosiga brevicollis MX1]|uniref:Mitochondrial 2-oxoglutarate/malate carrier protein n=1 Tax=Monosiga brevicollis TaxID=81824 RepID=A9UVK8_MONBE|nr:uncharacterized protein MONBRDRAFT_18424 [Monosiga brevicollis MX1]EDQ90600.1 predicted protein [Monosiga brevicollis MX1]|eukprot:XP_001744651.1 hypothetical protein [Monosiga brevicollis MX1]